MFSWEIITSETRKKMFFGFCLFQNAVGFELNVRLNVLSSILPSFY